VEGEALAHCVSLLVLEHGVSLLVPEQMLEQ
jgi:hypothetical protein